MVVKNVRLQMHRKQPNDKHQRARATASRANGTISVRALRCMR